MNKLSIFSDWKPREILVEIKELMRGKSLTKSLPLICEKLNIGPSDYRKFSHTIDSHSWKGIVYLKRNSLMGSIFSYFDKKALIIRGYPKIKYAEESRVLDKPIAAESKYDGTNLGFWIFPNGHLMGKTRMVERYDIQGYHGMKWEELTIETGFIESIKKICKDDYSPFGELYGSKNPGEFIRYTIPINIRFFEVCDLRTMEWIEYNKKQKLLETYGLEPVELIWSGILTRKDVERLEYEAKAFVKEDGYEGFVAKWYDPEDKDTYLCKLKCEEIKELAWSLSPKSTIPRGIISKAVKKAWDNQGMLQSMDDIEKFVCEELKEEVEESLITASKKKIKEIIYSVFSPVEGQPEVWNFFISLENDGIEISNKGKVLSITANKFKGIDPKILYKCYCAYIASKEKKT